MIRARVSSCVGLVVVAMALSGCASIVGKFSQPITVNTPPTAATCTLQNVDGTWTVTSPGSVRVRRSKTDLVVRCKKDGFADGQTVAEAGFQWWVLGNVLIGGLLGLVIDFSTGSSNRYPSTVEVPMTPNVGASAPANVAPAATNTASDRPPTS